jgi:hypothetical protein
MAKRGIIRVLRRIRSVVGLSLLLGGGVLAATAPTSAGAGQSVFPDMRGSYHQGSCVGGTLAQCEASPQFPSTFTISTEDSTTGHVVLSDGGTGTISGCTMTIGPPITSATPSNPYQSQTHYNISADTNQLTGTFDDSYGRRAQPIFANRDAAGPDTCPTGGTGTPPPPPVLGKTANVTLVSGLVLIKPPPGKTLHAIRAAATRLVKGTGFVPLSQARQIPDGSQIDARAGTLKVVVANGQRRHTQQATLSGSVFSLSQTRSGGHKGLTTFDLLEGGFSGAPTYNSCSAHPATHGLAQTAAKKPSSHNVLQTLHASDNNGRFRTHGRYSAGTVRGTKWDTTDQCDGTLTTVHRGTVDVVDFARRKTITVHAGHSYLAKAPRRRK